MRPLISFYAIFCICIGVFTTANAKLSVMPIEASPLKESAVEAFASYYCGDNSEELKRSLQENQFVFDQKLLRLIDGKKCHIAYRPSLEGFSLSPDFGDIKEVWAQTQYLPLMIGRDKFWGDSFDILTHAQEILKEIPFQVITEKKYQKDGNTYPGLTWIEKDTKMISWTQDYFSSGYVKDKNILMIPHRLYEGNKSYGDRFFSFLNQLSKRIPHSHRSKISWEGGDLLVVKSPKTGEKILIQGNTHESYWSGSLTQLEKEHVLKTEFGVDRIITANFPGHTDYTVQQINSDTLLFSSYSEITDLDLCEISQIAKKDFRSTQFFIPKKLEKLTHYCSSTPNLEPQVLKDLIFDLVSDWNEVIMPEIYNRVSPRVFKKYTKDCEETDVSCLNDFLVRFLTYSGLLKLRESNRGDYEDFVNGSIDGNTNTRRFEFYEGIFWEYLENGNKKIYRKELLKLLDLLSLEGFRLIDLPRLNSNRQSFVGLSPINFIADRKRILLPSLGIHSFDQRVLDILNREIPNYKKYFIPANAQIFINGGVHCTLKVVRYPGDSQN